MRYGRNPVHLLRFPAPAAVFLGLVAVIAGILGMHMVSATHHEPASAVAAFDAAGAASAGHNPAAAPGLSVQSAADGGAPHGCAEPCSQDQGHAGSICTLMIFLLLLLVMPKVLSLRRRSPCGLRRGRPAPVAVPRAPSLLELCISRT
ncbi:DUF6153 family protein [Arthrobacter sp. ATA002]|uniref:DUF6153 family protein n=1 Tax=Arthrobacter sp. ATA002 TaxID=2991715 RepID=UPI0022A710F9|nr:DUF6153 family protein [Arthrobacter sp. ATA002]WAP50571.1 DUF6153 family protein [Arthrobacter sp. ATA002]